MTDIHEEWTFFWREKIVNKKFLEIIQTHRETCFYFCEPACSYILDDFVPID